MLLHPGPEDRIAPGEDIVEADSLPVCHAKTAQAPGLAAPLAPLPHLESLESESVHILRETVAGFENPVLLFSGGKDSSVLLRLATKAFRPGGFPFPLLHIDTGHNFPEVIDFRDRVVAELGERLIVRSVQDSIDGGRIIEIKANQSRNAMQTVTLLEAIEELGFDACIGGARRDEEKSRAKERIFSFRDEFGHWEPRSQRPELWNLYNTRVAPGEHMRVFPISNWTEMDVWRYIARENIEIPPLYFSHTRAVVQRKDKLFPASDLLDIADGEIIEERTVRFRTVGDMSCSCPVDSEATTIDDVIAETMSARITERGATRADDQTSEASMEIRKRAGYF